MESPVHASNIFAQMDLDSFDCLFPELEAVILDALDSSAVTPQLVPPIQDLMVNSNTILPNSDLFSLTLQRLAQISNDLRTAQFFELNDPTSPPRDFRDQIARCEDLVADYKMLKGMYFAISRLHQQWELLDTKINTGASKELTMQILKLIELFRRASFFEAVRKDSDLGERIKYYLEVYSPLLDWRKGVMAYVKQIPKAITSNKFEDYAKKIPASALSSIIFLVYFVGIDNISPLTHQDLRSIRRMVIYKYKLIQHSQTLDPEEVTEIHLAMNLVKAINIMSVREERNLGKEIQNMEGELSRLLAQKPAFLEATEIIASTRKIHNLHAYALKYQSSLLPQIEELARTTLIVIDDKLDEIESTRKPTKYEQLEFDLLTEVGVKLEEIFNQY